MMDPVSSSNNALADMTDPTASSHSVLVGMSGGVDSSVAAALLVEQGYNVVGAYMKNWTLDVPGMQCPWAEDLAYAKRTAVKLGIDFRVYDFQEEYKREVVDYLVAEYEAGRTPNPDIMCNQQVKFGSFLDAAHEGGFDYIATGHYARTHDGKLFQAADAHKDQTYFLYRVGAQALQRVLFPLGDITKDQVRAMAAQRNLPAANKPDSQGICFIGEASIQDFLRQYVQPKPGPIVDAETGKQIGAHEGALFFTLGQRKGLGIGGGTPYVVVDKDMTTNTVVVAHAGTHAVAKNLTAETVVLTDCAWVSGQAPASGTYLVRTRHTGKLLEASIEPQGNTQADVHFVQPEERVAPGQSVVVYYDQECIGGGIAR